ncbi:hypothetical protein [Symmachiella dynata]|uniref:hypothetical protein n=1 Tax=Symmachiella dynata TaxID=2527995 RepID=UPI0030EF8DDD
MRFDHVRIRLEPLSVSNCLDMAVLFYRQYFKPIAQLLALFALPCCVAVYVMSYFYEYDLRLPALLFFVLSSPMGILLISGTAAASFGEPFSWGRVLKQKPGRLISLFFRGILLRAAVGSVILMFFLEDWDLAIRVLLGFVLCLFPGVWLAIRSGFLVERTVLADLSNHLHETRGSKLIHKQFGDLLIGGGMIVGYCALLWLVFFMVFDLAINFLFHVPIFFPRLGPDGEMGFLLWGDPKVLCLITFCAFLVYPLGRLAWFFTYIDLRVRRDCWDMELELAQEADRLEATS